MTLLGIDNLSVEYETAAGPVNAVNDVSFEVKNGERVGLVGESGCGKTTIAKTIIGILPENGSVSGGSITLNQGDDSIDLVTANRKQLRKIRWEEIALIAQSAMNALDPMYSIGEQIVEGIRLHEDTPKKKAMTRARKLLDQVGIDEEYADAYPHQLSGGMRQRAMIAMAMALQPSLIIADEPTTALDVITQDHILAQIDKVIEERDKSLLMITHDISVVAETCDRVGVMYAGELVEVGPVEEVFVNPQHPYTQGLMNAFPSLDGQKSELITIKGEPPDLRDLPTGCSFADRCPYPEERCLQSSPELTQRGENRHAACFVTDDGYDIQKHFSTILEETEKWQKL